MFSIIKCLGLGDYISANMYLPLHIFIVCARKTVNVNSEVTTKEFSLTNPRSSYQ